MEAYIGDSHAHTGAKANLRLLAVNRACKAAMGQLGHGIWLGR
jgi:hypothetical protein